MIIQYVTPVAAKGGVRETILVGQSGDFARGTVKKSGEDNQDS
jgi:hypothetical protein